jgi:hypothetical protein
MMMLNLQAAAINNPEQYQHPAVLVQMSYFLREALLIVKSNTLPCVLVGPANSSRQCYVVGVRRKLAKGAQVGGAGHCCCGSVCLAACLWCDVCCWCCWVPC